MNQTAALYGTARIFKSDRMKEGDRCLGLNGLSKRRIFKFKG